ncbi:MAG: sporulation protein YqfD [Oscillibacter sp.]|nr:sporulation protein YqfD [Oscillibacter sp.]
MRTGPLRWARGEIRVRAVCAGPERLLNLCAVLGIPFRDPRRDAPDALSLTLARRHWPRLRQAAEKHLPGCSFTVVRQMGAPVLFARLRRRPALVITLTISAFALFLGSFFIWEFDVTGCETVPEEAVLRALERQGVGIGSFGLALNGQDLRNHVLLDVPELAWMTVNVSGCRARVQVAERREPPEILNESLPANIAARRAGLVLEVRALDGQARVMRGMSVDEGDLLISGTEELGTLAGGVRTMAAHGSVTARTWHTLTASVPLSGVEKRTSGERFTGVSLILGKRRLQLYGDISHRTEAGTQYDKTAERRRLSLLGAALPVTVVRETYQFYTPVSVERTEAEAKASVEAALRSCLDAEVSPYGEIRSTLCTARRRGDVLDVTLSAECVEEIGVSVPLTADGAG